MRLQILLHHLDLALAEQGGRRRRAQRHDRGMHEHEADGGGEAHSLGSRASLERRLSLTTSRSQGRMTAARVRAPLITGSFMPS